MIQDDMFNRFEADRWFLRNRRALTKLNHAIDLPLKLISLYDLKPERVLEIGAANGARLAAIRDHFGSRVVAVEPSMQALLNGKSVFPSIAFIRGTAAAIPLRCSFDLVIINFVLHWIDRRNLLQAVAEIDRMVEEGGYLIIGDFRPVNYLRVPYHHIPNDEVFTYKQDYAAIFVSSGGYHSVSLLTTRHEQEGLFPLAGEGERIGTCLLRKETEGHYCNSWNGKTNK